VGSIEGYKASDRVISIEVTENVDVSVAIHSCRPAAQQNADAVIASSSAQLVFGSLKRPYTEGRSSAERAGALRLATTAAG
jgi:hypothetical protein